ncbi:MAG: trypsin-like peptidase domain-containing protein [Vicinamibacterales bacterium]
MPSLASVADATVTKTTSGGSKTYSDADLKAPPTRAVDAREPRSTAVDSLSRGAASLREDVLQAVMPSVVTIEAGQSSGSGFFVSRDMVVTNHHVVGDHDAVRVRLLNGETLAGSVSRLAADADLAIVRVDQATTARPLPLAPADTVRVGEDVMVLGSALGLLQGTVTRGIISAVRNVGGLTLLQTDAAINPGNSGGPVINSRGAVVGITTAKMNGAESLGFAIASDHASRLLAGSNSVLDASPGGADSPLNAAFGGPSVAHDVERETGSAQYESAVRSLAAQADQLDAYWQRYTAMCQQRATPTTRERRAWLGVWEPASAVAESPDCSAVRRDFVSMASALDHAMTLASEAARRAGVFPGEARAVREKYGMSWRGWDR